MRKFCLCLAVVIVFSWASVVRAKTLSEPYKTPAIGEALPATRLPVTIIPMGQCGEKKVKTGRQMKIEIKLQAKTNKEFMKELRKNLKELGIPRGDIDAFMDPAVLYQVLPQLDPQRWSSISEFNKEVRAYFESLPEELKAELKVNKDKLSYIIDM